ncbi:MAG TPA: thiamine-phosphate kinase [Syntrophales bacterium]|nr:thiamine-phosphate kinase [Syntrophales bacterium]HOT49311.1 thiamine-phosphate kinase [Syntrophales bacterium]HQK48807.1 thiamine-phosphate kinase [Syntrophales bacterium]
MTEDDFLEALFKRMPRPPGELVIPPGDDCAGFREAGGSLLLIAADQVVEGRHFLDEGAFASSPQQVGRKLLARNLSDIAAMGGTPLYCLSSVALGSRHGAAWLDRFFDGMLDLARRWDTHLIGGDLARGAGKTVASLTIVGRAVESRVLRRSGAGDGDGFWATGLFGRSFPTGHHLEFEPRLAEARWLCEQGFASAMIDVSDGLLIDAGRLCRASGVSLFLDVGAVPRRGTGTSAEQALSDGEDYELLFSVPKEKERRLGREWPFRDLPLTRIGELRRAPSPDIFDTGGSPLAPAGPPGWDHFRR